MRAVVQRVRSASVSVDGAVVGSVGRGIVVLLGIGHGDDERTARHLADRVAALRIHDDGEGRMNRDLATSGGGALVISQFTLHADTSRGHRPSFLGSAPPEQARPLCAVFADALRGRGLAVDEGVFGAEMHVDIAGDGPVTIVLTAGEPPWEADAGGAMRRS